MNNEFKDEIKFLVENVVNKEASVVFYGSSSIRLWESLAKDFQEIKLINIAFGGSTIEDCILHYPELLGQTNPESIVFYAGDNDIGNGANSLMVLNRFIALYDLIRKDFPTVPLIYISIKPSPVRVEHLETIIDSNQIIKEYISLQKNVFFLDIFEQMMRSDSTIDASLFIEDQLHMNEKGYSIWKKVLAEFLDQQLSQA